MGITILARLRSLLRAAVSDKFPAASLWKRNSIMSIISRVIHPALMVAVYLATPAAARAQAAGAGQDQPSEETWNSIKGDIFKDRPILDGSGLVVLDAPKRAEDSAIVPIGMRVDLARDDKRTRESLMRLVAELSDGQLYGVKTFVKASGGCSAPAASNSDATKAMLGQMKFRTFRP